MQTRLNKRDFSVIILCCAVYVIHSLFFREWIVDDAGISFAYTRNLATGYGLVSQPGHVPVEGFSNPAWVFLLTPFFLLNLFDPIITPKIIGTVLVCLSFLLLYSTLRKQGNLSGILSGPVLLLLAFNTSFVVWTSSGLENPLYVFLIVSLFTLISIEDRQAWQEILIGLCTGCIALTRPDGMLFIGLYPAWNLLSAFRWSSLKKIILYFLPGVLLTSGSYLIFRIIYFGDFLPNTFYAKYGTGTSRYFYLPYWKWTVESAIPDLLNSLTGNTGIIVLLVLFCATIWYMIRKLPGKTLWLMLVFLFWTISIYVILPLDWMGEYRFATPVYPFFYAYIAMLVQAIVSKYLAQQAMRIEIIFVVAFALFSFLLFLPRSIAFRENPTVSFSGVASRYAFRYNNFASELQLEDASFLVPDLGGTLYYSDMTIYDLAGLADVTIARTLYQQDKTELYDYIFEQLQPTFIRTHGFFTYISQLQNAPQLQEDYIIFCQYFDNSILEDFGVKLNSGTYIRRDAITEVNQAMLEEIQSALTWC